MLRFKGALYDLGENPFLYFHHTIFFYVKVLVYLHKDHIKSFYSVLVGYLTHTDPFMCTRSESFYSGSHVGLCFYSRQSKLSLCFFDN